MNATEKYDTDKSDHYLDNYLRHFSSFQDEEIKLLELGVFHGGSLLLWRDFFSKGRIFGLDCEPSQLDDKTGRIRVFKGRQEDTELLDQIAKEVAPDGFDIIIDDASHIGELTRTSFWHLFDNHLKPGGFYVIEDWGTGYWESWADGKRYVPGRHHTFGMVGFIKELVDECAIEDITHPERGILPTRKSRFQFMEIHRGQVFVKKKSSKDYPICLKRDLEETVRYLNEFTPKKQTESFIVTAIISAHNEGDVIYHVIGDLIRQGVQVYLIDHSSTDDTVQQASKWLNNGLIHIEHFPEDAGYSKRNKSKYIWRDLLRRKEELASQITSDWFIHHDADEFRESPWPDLSLKEAIYLVDRMGYNTIDFELLNFRAVNNDFEPHEDVRNYLRYFESSEDFNKLQIKAWKKQASRVDLTSSGGHEVIFSERRVFPIKFILRHYPIRSQAHGTRKVLRERLERFDDEELARGWHVQYRGIGGNQNFLYDVGNLTLYDDDAIRLKILAEGFKSNELIDVWSIKNKLAALEQELANIHSSRWWKVIALYNTVKNRFLGK